MATFRELCIEQKKLHTAIKDIGEAVSKYGSKRTIALVDRKIGEIEKYWADYKINHQSILGHVDRNDGEEYFTNSEYSLTESLFQSLVNKFAKYKQDISNQENHQNKPGQSNTKNSINEDQNKQENGKIKLLNIRYQELDKQLTHFNSEFEKQHQASFYTIKSKHLQDAWKNIQVLRDELIIEGYIDSPVDYAEYQELVENTLIQAQSLIETTPFHRVNNNPNQLIKPLKIPQFQGEYSNWRTFHDLYRSMISASNTESIS